MTGWEWALVLAAGVIGFLLPLVPYWLSVGVDIAPEGPACGFQDDPGSGMSRLGVEVVDWGLAPQRACVPIEPEPLQPPYTTMSIPTSGPEFDDAVEKAKREAATQGWDASDFALDGNRSGPIYAELLAWPLVSVVTAAGFIAITVLVIRFQRWRRGDAESA